jgi:hypothetical protein
MNVTYSGLTIVKGPAAAPTPAAGATINVTGANQPAISGSGFKGKYSVETIPAGV